MYTDSISVGILKCVMIKKQVIIYGPYKVLKGVDIKIHFMLHISRYLVDIEACYYDYFPRQIVI